MDDLPDWYTTEFDACLLEIGRVTGMWAHLEYHIDEWIWSLANVDKERGACLTAQMMAPLPRMKALISLAGVNAAPDEFIERLNQFSSKVQKLGGKRNRFAHDTIHINIENRRLVKIEVTADRLLRHVEQPVVLDDIRALWLEIRDAIQEMDKLKAIMTTGRYTLLGRPRGKSSSNPSPRKRGQGQTE